MLYKFNSMGYFGGVMKVSRGPWFKEYFVEDDGLDWYYSFTDSTGQTRYLLSSNMVLKDRVAFEALYKTMNRNNSIALFASLYLGFETAMRAPRVSKLAWGWKLVWTGIFGFAYKTFFNSQTSAMYAPTMKAYLRKYGEVSKNDLFAINDDKKKYFYIDTSEYANYSNADLGDEYHCNHGPQAEPMDATWLAEVDKFLAGEENHMKDHPRYLSKYPYTFIDKSFPTQEAASTLMHGK